VHRDKTAQILDEIMKTDAFKENLITDETLREIEKAGIDIEKNLMSARNTIENVFENFSRFMGNLSETVSAK
jgi:hypothetical protein